MLLSSQSSSALLPIRSLERVPRLVPHTVPLILSSLHNCLPINKKRVRTQGLGSSENGSTETIQTQRRRRNYSVLIYKAPEFRSVPTILGEPLSSGLGKRIR